MCYELSNHPYFDRVIIGLIFLNVIAMGCVFQGLSDSGLSVIGTLNNIFLGIFHAEAAIKIGA